MEGYNMTQIERLKRQCYEMKLKALDMTLQTGSFGAHIGGAFSAMEILSVLYEIANVPNGTIQERDRIFLSKGHGVLALYTALSKKGFISDDELKTFDMPGTKLHGHPHKNEQFAIEMSSGSLGLGFSYAVGVALANKRLGRNNHIYVILGDGECEEGIIWEAAMSASHFCLDNLTIIIDENGFQLDGETKIVMDTSSLAEKFRSFGFFVEEVDGHDIKALLETLSERHDQSTAIIAHTVKAHGISFLENNKISHQCSLTKKKYEQAVQEIKHTYGME